MLEVRDKFEQRAEEAIRILDEYKLRLIQAIEEAHEGIREEAEGEAARIVGRAREESADLIVRTRKEVEQIKREAE